MSYDISRDILFDDIIESSNNQLSLFNNMSNDTYLDLKQQILMEASSKELKSYIDNISSSEKIAFKMVAINKLQNYLRLKLYNNYEFNSFIIITQNNIIGSFRNKDSYYVKRLKDDVHNITTIYEEQIFNKYHNNNERYVSGKIDDNTYIIGTINYDYIFKNFNNNFLILDNQLNVRWINFNQPESIEKIKNKIRNIEKNSISNIKEQNYVISILKSNEEYYCHFYDLNEVKKQLNKLILIIMLIIIFLFIIFGSVSIVFANNIVIRIKDLKNTIKNTEDFDDDMIKKIRAFKSKDLYIRKNVSLFYRIDLIPVIIIIIVNIMLFSNVINKNSFNKINNLTNQVSTLVENRFQQFEKNIKFYSIDSEFQQTMVDVYENKNTSIDSNILLESVYYLNVYDHKGDLLYTTNKVIDELLNVELEDDESIKTIIRKIGNKDILTVIKPIRLLNESEKVKQYTGIGYLEAGLEINLDRLLNNITLSDALTVYLIDKNNNVLLDFKGYRYNEDIIDKIIQLDNNTHIFDQKGDIYIDKYKLKDGNNTLIFVNNIDKNIKLKFMIVKNNTLLLLVFMAIVWILAIILTYRILKPISDLRKEMNKLNYGQVVDLSYIKCDVELMDLMNSFEDMLKRLNKMAEGLKQKEVEYYQVEKKKNEIELSLLQSQINPHFFYNTITSIVFLLKAGNNEKGIKMLLLTGKYFKLGLYRGETMISIEEEIQFVKSYIEIQKIRMQNIIDIEFNVSDNLKDYKVIRFIMQPLVENAIVHGRKVGSYLHIDISIKEEDNHMIIEVCDNGKGIDHTVIEEIKSVIEKGKASKHTGIRNINDRIRLRFGNEYGVNNIDSDDNGTVIELKVPIIKE
jgi:two-component system sensor histidine kinase YesM